MRQALKAIVLGASVIGLLGGCASTRLVENDVTSFARWAPAPPAPGSTYRFERLPSQQQADVPQARLEGLAHAALARVGLQHNPSAAAFSVQVSASSQPLLRSRWDGAYPYGSPNIFIGGGSGGAGANVGFGFGFGFPLGGMDTPQYRREISIVMRELRSNVAVYETRAVSEEPWVDTDPVLAAMLDAALRGFPVPSPGTRRVNVEIKP